MTMIMMMSYVDTYFIINFNILLWHVYHDVGIITRPHNVSYYIHVYLLLNDDSDFLIKPSLLLHYIIKGQLGVDLITLKEIENACKYGHNSLSHS
jgi:hypothetical protein